MNLISTAICLVGISTLSLALTVTGCQKSNDDVLLKGNDTAPAFIDKDWRISTVTSDPLIDLDGDGQLDRDLKLFLRPCDVAKTWRFEKDGQLASDHKLACDQENNAYASSPNKANFWTYDAGKAQLTISLNTATGAKALQWDVVESSATSLTVSVLDKHSVNPFRLVMTWTAQ